MNQPKKILALIFALVMLLSFSACGKNNGAATAPPTEPPADESVIVAQAQAHIEKGEYLQAFDLLYHIEDPSAATKDLLACFRFLEATRRSDDGSKKTFGYDKSGNLLTETGANGHGFTYTYTYTYDQGGNLLTKGYTDSAGAQKLWTYTYDQGGNLLVEDFSDQEGLWHQKLYSYGENGQALKMEFTDIYGAYDVTTYAYDDKGNLLSERYIESSDFNSVCLYTYDDKGNLLKSDYSDSEDNLHQWLYSYDKLGHLLTKDYYDSRERWEENNWTYENGVLLSFYHATSDNYWEQTTYTLDGRGNIAAESTKTSAGATVTTEITWELFYDPNFAK